MKRKVAVCISGQFRFYQKSIDSIMKFLIEPYDADVFCCFSKETRNVSKPPIKAEKEIENTIKDYFKDRLKAFKVCVDEEFEKREAGFAQDYLNWLEIYHKKRNIHPRNRKMELSANLKYQYELENYIKYDIVINVRPSLLLSEEYKIDFDIKEGVVCVAGKYYNDIPRVWDGIWYAKSDTFSYAASDMMGSFPSMNGIKECAETLFKKLKLKYFIFSPEHVLLYNWVVRKDLKLKMLPLPLRYIHPDGQTMTFDYHRLKPIENKIATSLPHGFVLPKKYRNEELLHLYK